MADLRIGLYGLNSEELAEADRLGLSAWSYAEQFRGAGATIKPLKDEEKREEWKRLFEERISERAADLKIWMDGNGDLWLGWFRCQASDGQQYIIIVAKVQLKSQTLVAVPMRRESTDVVDGVAWSRPWLGQQTWERVKTYRRIVPPGVF